MKIHCYLLAILGLFFSCSQEESIVLEKENSKDPDSSLIYLERLKIENTPEDLSSQEALAVAQLFKTRSPDLTTRSISNENVKDITVIPDEAGKPLMYVVNFTEGFTIISAIKKSPPVLAWSEKGYFDAKALAGSSVWLEEIKDGIIEMKKDTTLFKESSWMAYEKQSLIPSSIQTRSSGLRGDVYFWRAETIHDIIYTNLYDYYEYEELSSPNETLNGHYFYTLDEVHFDFFNEQKQYLTELAEYNGYNKDVIIIHVKEYSTYTRKEALLNTYWHQGAPYNGKIPGRLPAGCVTIAAAQILNYHRKPAYFSWDAINNMMGDNLALQDFILDVATKMDVEFTPIGTGADEKMAENGFKKYNYKVARTGNYSYSGIRAELMANRPVFMIGVSNTSGLGHAWVCDGFSYYGSRKVVTVYFPERIGYNPNAVVDYNPYKPVREIKYGQGGGESIYYHMNWGWGSTDRNQSTNNGWYMENNVNTSKGNYNQGRRYMYITPPNN